MNVLAITSLFPTTERPSAGRFNERQMAHLPTDIQVAYLTPIPWLSRFRSNRQPGTKRSTVPAPRSALAWEKPTFWYLPGVARSLHGHQYAWSIEHSASHLKSKHNPQVIYGMFAYPDGYATARLAGKWRLPFVLKVHGSDIHQLGKDSSRRNLVRETLASARVVVCVSETLANEVRELEPLARTTIVRNGVDPEMFSTGSQGEARDRLFLRRDLPLVLYVGRFEEIKGADFIPSLAKSLGKGVQWSLVGDGNLLESVRKEWPAEVSVRFAGQVLPRNLPDWYRAANVIVIPSRNEGIPNALLEGLSCDRAVVASDVGGISEVTPDRTVLRLTPSGDSQRMAAEIQSILQAPAAMGQARAAVSHLTWFESGRALGRVLSEASR